MNPKPRSSPKGYPKAGLRCATSGCRIDEELSVGGGRREGVEEDGERRAGSLSGSGGMIMIVVGWDGWVLLARDAERVLRVDLPGEKGSEWVVGGGGGKDHCDEDRWME